MEKIKNFIKKEAVFSIAALAAAISAIFVPPSKNYIGYINFSVLGLLFALMCVVKGLSRLNVLNKTAELLIRKTGSLRSLSIVLWVLCFMSAMLITNDVALITFVPLAAALLQTVHKEKYIIPTIVLQTVAANLGSMLTPMGNPQNLYIYEHYGLSIGEFFALTLPCTALGFVLLLIASFLMIKNDTLNVSVEKTSIKGGKMLVLYCILGVLCLLSVLKKVDYRITVLAVFISLVITDRPTLLGIDWFLLLTFVMFFIFVGNLAATESIKNFISGIISGRECVFAILISQVISNVPCAAMLSGFTDNYRALLLGCDVGGLGTLVASLASLISYRLYTAEYKSADKKAYLLCFTAVNIIFLIPLTILALVIL